MEFKKKLWIGIFILALISPIGIILPELFNASDAWGEWSVETLEKLIGFIPEKLKANADLWRAPIPDYNLGSQQSPVYVTLLSYVFSGIIGILIISLLMYSIRKVLKI